MIDLFQDRRIFINNKKKQFQKNGLPEIRYPMNLVKRTNDDIIFRQELAPDFSYQPLSNILISKRICPINP